MLTFLTVNLYAMDGAPTAGSFGFNNHPPTVPRWPLPARFCG